MLCRKCKKKKHTTTIVWPEALTAGTSYYSVVRVKLVCEPCKKRFYDYRKGEFAFHLFTVYPWSLEEQQEFIRQFNIPFSIREYGKAINPMNKKERNK